MRAAWLRALEYTTHAGRDPKCTLPQMIDRLAGRFGSRPALLDETESIDFDSLNRRVNRYARWACDRGLGCGDVVALLALNCADYIAIWLGISRVGATVALLNVHLVGAALAHALRIATPRLIIVDAGLAEEVIAVSPQIGNPPCWVRRGECGELPRLDTLVLRYSEAPIAPRECPFPERRSRALLLYTSGTTGLPKAANVSHERLANWSHWFAGMMDATPDDRMYDCLPLYHSVGGVVATGAMLVCGGSVVIRKRFSASRFWDDVHTTDCTLFSYVGEMCRFLANGPAHPLECEHRLRLCVGNGMSAGIWDKFKQRFNIPKILEFYAATEGSFSLYNCEGKRGAIGRIPKFLAHRIHVALVKFDAESGNPKLGPDGFCILSEPGEIGEALGKLSGNLPAPGEAFEGYLDVEASERKILRNVFQKGDAWFRTGDLMRRNVQGFFFFCDRVGDTYRWKGENVSTVEVESVVGSYPGVVQVAAYGVVLPGIEGCAGMVAIVPGALFDLEGLHVHLRKNLPFFARPMFLRICKSMDTTETFKPRKRDLVRAGYDPASTTDSIFVNDATAQRFGLLTQFVYDRIQGGEPRAQVSACDVAPPPLSSTVLT